MKKILAALAFLAVVPSAPQAQTAPPVIQQVVISDHRKRFDTNPSNPPVPAVVRYILIDPGNAVLARDGFEPLERVAVLVLFVGGEGTLGLQANQINTGSPNFLGRNRHHFAAEGFVVAVVDAANDFNARPGGLRGARLPDRPLGGHHVADLVAVMGDLRARYPAVPIWAVGNSRGTVSAGVTALWVTPPADGLVLTSTLTGPDASEDMSGLALELVESPVLIVTHRDDACPITKPEDSEALRQRFTSSSKVRVRSLNGGSTPISLPCDPLAPHGFFGIDQKAVDAITKWVRRRED
jgi:hypothetical protein